MRRKLAYIFAACLLLASCRGADEDVFTLVTVDLVMPEGIEVLSVAVNMQMKDQTYQTVTSFDYRGLPVELKLLKGLYVLSRFNSNIRYVDKNGATRNGTLSVGANDINSRKFPLTADREQITITTQVGS